MLDLETLIEETAADPDLIELQCCIEDDNLNQAPEVYKPIIKRLTHRWGITLVDDRIIIPQSLRYAAINALHFGHPGINKMCGGAAIFWWPNIRADIARKAKTCSACLNAGKNLGCQIPSTKTKIEPPQNPREEIQMDFTGNLNSKHFEYSPFILVAVYSNSRWPVAKEYTNIYGVPKSIKTDRSSAFISKDISKYCNENNIIRKYATANLHTGTGLAERTIQSLKNLKANLEDGINLRDSLDKALHLLRFTIHSEIQKTPFDLYIGQKPRSKLTNLKNAFSADAQDLSVYITRSSTGEITDHLVMSKKKANEPKYRRGMTFSRTRRPLNTVSTNSYPFSIYEKAYKRTPWAANLITRYKQPSRVQNTQLPPKKVIHRKLISIPLPFQNAKTPMKRISTRQATMEQPYCSKTTDSSTTCIYRRKEPPKPNNHENSEVWIRRKEQPRNEKGQFTSLQKNTGSLTDLNLSIVSDDEFNYYNNSDGKPIHTNIEDELQIHSKETRLTPETGIMYEPRSYNN